MALELKLQLKVSQKLILTPALQQAIKLLPLTTLELVDLLNQEVVENPLLEEVSAELIEQADVAAKVEKSDPDSQPNTDAQDTWDDADYAYFFGDYLDNGYSPRAPSEFKDLPPIDNILSTVTSLTDHLTWQLLSQADNELLKSIGTAIIGNLNEDGYLVASIDEISVMGNWSESEVNLILSVIQEFDPIGVAARDLKECLLIQLQHLGLEGTPSEVIVKEHLHLLENHQHQELARKLNVSIDQLQQYIGVIRHLDPKPGLRYNSSPSQYVIPDVYIQKVENEYVVISNDEGLPQLRISPVYRQMLDKKNKHSADTRSYIKDKFRSALWLLKSIDQRQKTIYKVAMSIVKFQSEFLDHGIEYLKPLVLRDVANDIEMHESTVSRVVNN